MTDLNYVKFIQYNLNASLHRRCVYNC